MSRGGEAAARMAEIGDAEPTDAELLADARAGVGAALDRLLARHEPRIYRFVLKMCRDPEEAKDALQDTLLAAARSLSGFRGDASFSTWLFSIARSFCIKRRRRSKFAPAREQSLESEGSRAAEELPDPGRSPDEVVEGRRIERALEHAIDALAPKYREVLVLRDVEGLSAPEVAQVLGVGIDAVKSRLHRARLAVRADIAPLLGPPFAADARAPGCPDVLPMLSRHLEDELSPQVCAKMERHLLACPRCRDRCDSLRRTLALCRATPVADAVPTAVAASVRAALREFLTRPGTLCRGLGSHRREIEMETVEVTEQNFAEVVNEGIVLLDFWASWCGPCRAFAPVFEAAAQRNPDVMFGKIDTEAQQGLAAVFDIRAIPTLVVLRDGVILAQQAGAIGGGTLDRIVREVAALDIDEIKRKIANENQADRSASAEEG